MDELLRLLANECTRLEYVHYRTSVALLLLRGDETRFLPRAADEIHAAVDDLSQVELLRATVVSRLADELGVPEHLLTLSALIQAAPTATASRLRALQERLRSVLTDLHELAGASTTVAASELESVRRSLGRWSGSSPLPDGYVVSGPAGPARFDGAF